MLVKLTGIATEFINTLKPAVKYLFVFSGGIGPRIISAQRDSGQLIEIHEVLDLRQPFHEWI